MDIITQLSRDHENILEEAIILKSSILVIKDIEKAPANLEKISSFFQAGVIPHFDFEEKKIFPSLLGSASNEEKELVRVLLEEHASMLREIERFAGLNLKFKSGATSDLLGELCGLGKEIVDALLSHARKEDKELFPILRNKGYKF